LELELEKIRMERAKISEKQNQMGAGSNLMRGDTAAARNPMMGSLENYSGDFISLCFYYIFLLSMFALILELFIYL
jgi:hypothetical protein